MSNALVGKSLALLSALVVSTATAESGYEESVLRIQRDAARGREWLLTREGVLVFDSSKHESVHVSLPGWLWADESLICPPDLALGPKGEALVSSNVAPTLWRIDPLTLSVTRHAPVLDAHADKDVGFSGLVFSPAQGAFFAVSHFGALWRIDPQLSRAQHVALSEPVLGACGVSVRRAKNGFNRFFGLCVRGRQGGWTVNLAPDRRSGYVVDRNCV
jgi:hypothetical protein